MARKHKNKVAVEADEDFGMDEVDAFADARDQVLLEKAGLNEKSYDVSNDSNDESDIEGVMDIDSDVEIEKYKKKFQGPIDESDEEYFREEGDNEDEEGEDEEKWGGDYYGAEDAEDAEDEKLLEEEAKRLQKKHMEDLNMEDFMLDEVEDWKSKKETKVKDDEGKEGKLDELIKNGDKQSRMDMISKKYPEYLPLVLEIKNLKPIYEELKKDVNTSDVKRIKFKALSIYLGSIVSYFSIFVNNLSSGEPFEMKDEDVMVSILSSRELWRQAKGVREDVVGKKENSEEGKKAEEQEQEQEQDEDEDSEIESESGSGSEEEEEDVESQSDDETIPDFETVRHIRTTESKKIEDMDDIDLEDKQKRRKNLRFYTSRIDKKEQGRKEINGDDDAYYDEASSRHAAKNLAFRGGRSRGKGRK